jgi:tetratricopeptide (TPR) repeat protein
MARDLATEFTRGEDALNAAEREHDNIRAALRWAIETGAIEDALETVGALWRFWHLRGHLQEGVRWATEVLGLSHDRASHGRTRALNARAGLTYWIGDYAAARRDYDEMLASARAVGDRASEMEALYSLGYVYGIDADYEAARTAYAESRDIAREIGDGLGVTNATFGIAFTDWLDGQFAASRDGVLAVLPDYQKLGDRYAYYNAIGVLGRAQLSLGDLVDAKKRALEHLNGAVEIGDRTMTSMAFHDLASIAAKQHDLERGLLLDGASQALVDSTGGGAPSALVGLERADELAAQAGMTADDIRASLDRGAALSLDQAISLARSA